MAKADWTYQVAPAGSPAVGLEEYVVEAASGARVGKVTSVLARGDEIYVAVERGQPPLRHDVRAVPWRDVERLEHSALTIRLRLSEEALDDALELDPDKGVEDDEAEARRVTELPQELRPSSAPDAPGPVDRPTYVVALALGAGGLFALLVLVIFALAVDFTWHFALFVVPAALLALAAVFAYRSFRNPYERR